MNDVLVARVAPAILKLHKSSEFKEKMAAGVERMRARKAAKLAAEMEAAFARIDAEEEAREERDRYHYELDREAEREREAAEKN